jgi:hypothetical protein
VLSPKKTAGLSAPSFSPFRGQKSRAPNHCFQLGISDSSYEGAKIIRLAPIVNRLLGQSLLLRIAENLLKFTSTQQSRKKILCEFLDADFPHKYR